MARVPTHNPLQGNLFQNGAVTAELLSLEAMADAGMAEFVHRRNFGVTQAYLLELSKFNNYFKTANMSRSALDGDNLFLRKIFGGIKNSGGMPPEIFDALNLSEIVLMGAGISTRKLIYSGEVPFFPRGAEHNAAGPIRVKRDPTSFSQSRIAMGGHLEGKHLYEIMEHLLAATGVEAIYKKHKKDWAKTSQSPDSKEKRKYLSLNPYDPQMLKERMVYLEIKHPHVLQRFKEVLAAPYIPERVERIDGHGNITEVINPDGYRTPGKTYKRGVAGRSFHRLKEYARETSHYFELKERHLLSSNPI